MPSWMYPYLGAFLIGLSKAGFATGLGMLTTPLLATAVPARQAIGIILPLLCFADLLTLSAFTIAYAIAVLVPGPGVAAVVARALGGGFWAAFPMVLGILAGVGIGLRSKGPQPGQGDGTPVRVEPVKRGDLVEIVSAPGQLQPRTKVQISAKTTARIIDMPYKFLVL